MSGPIMLTDDLIVAAFARDAALADATGLRDAILRAAAATRQDRAARLGPGDVATRWWASRSPGVRLMIVTGWLLLAALIVAITAGQLLVRSRPTHLGIAVGCDPAVVDLQSGTVRVVAHTNCTIFEWSPDGRRLAWFDDIGVHVSALDGNGQSIVGAAQDGESITGLTWSPDGRFLSYRVERGRHSAEAESFAIVVPVDGGRPLRLPQVPTWSPDGSRLVVVVPSSPSQVGEYQTADVLVGAGDGSALRSIMRDSSGNVLVGWLPPASGLLHEWAWSPDDQTLTFTAGQGLYVVGVDGGEPRRLVPGTAYGGLFSPDGRRIAYRIGEWAMVTSGIGVVDLDGGHTFAIDLDDELVDGAVLEWSPDGRLLLFATVVPAGGERAAWRLHVASADGSESSTLPINPAGGAVAPGDGAFGAHWSGDGRQIVFYAQVSGEGDPPWRYYVVDPDGGNLRQIASAQNFEGGNQPVFLP